MINGVYVHHNMTTNCAHNYICMLTITNMATVRNS